MVQCAREMVRMTVHGFFLLVRIQEHTVLHIPLLLSQGPVRNGSGIDFGVVYLQHVSQS